MCWRTFKNKHKQPHVAKRNIKTIKLVYVDKDGIYPLLLNNLTYEINKQYNEKITTTNIHPWLVIEKGFHSYTNKMKDTFLLRLKDCKYEYIKLMYCIIPKGTTYYLNETGEYVSEAIIPISIETT